jgi:hypothetical protein
MFIKNSILVSKNEYIFRHIFINYQAKRQCTYNVTLRRVRENIVAVESNKYYIFLCECLCEGMSMRACVRVCVWGDGCECARVGLRLIHTYHFAPCHSPAVPCCYRFRLCLSRLNNTVRPCLIHTNHAVLWPCRFARDFWIPRHSTAGARHDMYGLTLAFSRRPAGDLPRFGFYWLPRGVSRLAVRIFPSTRGLSRRKRHCRSTAGARHDMCELVFRPTYPVCRAQASYFLPPLWLHHIFRNCLINGKILGKKSLNVKCVFWYSLQLLFETFFILRRNQRDIVINVKASSCKVPVTLVGF